MVESAVTLPRVGAVGEATLRSPRPDTRRRQPRRGTVGCAAAVRRSPSWVDTCTVGSEAGLVTVERRHWPSLFFSLLYL